MDMQIEISKQFPITTYDTRQVGIRWLNILRKYEKLILADYLRTIETWDHKPAFYSQVRYANANPRLFVWTSDDIYIEIDEGTNVRYDVMTTDFVPKTQPGVLRSFPGEGGFAYRDKNPRPGIEPRRFSITITRKYEKEIQKELQQATIEGLRVRKGI